MGIIINGQNDTIGPVDNSMSLLGTVSIGGTMTIEDFTNIDSVGLITARNGLHVTSGNVAIGHNNPLNTLHVAGAGTIARLESSTSTSGLRFDNSQANDGYVRYVNQDLLFVTADSEKLRIESGGFVGLGTNNPYHELHIQGSGDTRALITSGGTGDAVMMFENASGNTWGHGIDLTNNNYVVAYNSTSDPSLTSDNKLLVKTNGDVYIGNIAHSNDGGANTSYRTLTLTDTTNGAQVHLRGQSPKLFMDVTSSGNAEMYYDTGDLRILSGEPGDAGSTERLRVTSGGKVGINSEGTTAYLTIRDSEDGGNGNNGSGVLRFSRRNGSATNDAILYAVHDGSDGVRALKFDVGNSERFRVSAAGVNVTGIATATHLFEGTTRVASTGKAIAMAMLFG